MTRIPEQLVDELPDGVAENRSEEVPTSSSNVNHSEGEIYVEANDSVLNCRNLFKWFGALSVVEEERNAVSSDEQSPCCSSSYDDAARDHQFEIDLRRVKGLEVRKMIRDENCLFRSVADQVYGDSELYDLVRQMCIDLYEGDCISRESLTSYCNRKRRDKVYGNNMEIQALSEMYNRPIHIYSYSTEPIIIFHGRYNADTPPIRLSYHQRDHYNSLVDPRRLTVGSEHIVVDELPEHCGVAENKSEEVPTSSLNVDHRSDEQNPYLSSSYGDAITLISLLLAKISSFFEMEVEVEVEAAAAALNLLTLEPSVQTIFPQIPNSISQLLSPLTTCKTMSPPQLPSLDLQESIISIICTLSIPNCNKKLVAETPHVIPTLISALRYASKDTTTFVVLAFLNLSKLESNKELIAQSHVVEPLVALLETLSTSYYTDRFPSPNYELYMSLKLETPSDNMCLRGLLSLFEVLSTNRNCLKQLGEAVPFLFCIIRGDFMDENKECSVALLRDISLNDRSQLEAMREEESMFRTISRLAVSGTSRARKKARHILRALFRY